MNDSHQGFPIHNKEERRKESCCPTKTVKMPEILMIKGSSMFLRASDVYIALAEALKTNSQQINDTCLHSL